MGLCGSLATCPSTWQPMCQYGFYLWVKFCRGLSFFPLLAAFGFSIAASSRSSIALNSSFYAIKSYKGLVVAYINLCPLNVCVCWRYNWALCMYRHGKKSSSDCVDSVIRQPMRVTQCPTPEGLDPNVPLVPPYSAAHTPLTHSNEVICCRWMWGEHRGHRSPQCADSLTLRWAVGETRVWLARSGSYEGHL